MSQATREALVNNPKLSFTDDTQKSDLLDESITNTFLIAMLQWLLEHCDEPIELLAVKTDHPTPDGEWAHSGGKAADLYPSNWEGREEEACTNVMRGLANNPYCQAVGLGGVTQQWESYVTWPENYFTVFPDNDADHLHAGCANSVDGVGARAAAAGL